MVKIFFDGACEPVNPGGTASWGFLIRDSGQLIAEGSGIVGSGEGMTNNIGEYSGLLASLRKANELGIKEKLHIYGDSNLIVSMVAKKWGWNKKKTRWIPHDDTPHLKILLDEALKLLEGREYEIKWIPREENQDADRLSKKPLIETGIIGRESELRTCPVCGQNLARRKGRFGEFYGCSNYPKCAYTEKVR